MENDLVWLKHRFNHAFNVLQETSDFKLFMSQFQPVLETLTKEFGLFEFKKGGRCEIWLTPKDIEHMGLQCDIFYSTAYAYHVITYDSGVCTIKVWESGKDKLKYEGPLVVSWGEEE